MCFDDITTGKTMETLMSKCIQILSFSKRFQKWRCEFYVFCRGVANLKKILIWGSNLEDLTSVSGEELYEFEVIYPKRGGVGTPRPPLSTGL